jgi:hypothetical protein
MPNLPPTIMAIDPTRKGFAFAVLEAPSFLVDWGMKNAPPKSGDLRRKVDDLLSRYQPSLLVVEDLAARGCRRRKRARREIMSIERLAATRGVPIGRIARLAVQDTFAPRRSKYEVAVKLAEIFPVLAPRLPRRRKAYTTEDARMNIFDALGFARVFEERDRHRI